MNLVGTDSTPSLTFLGLTEGMPGTRWNASLPGSEVQCTRFWHRGNLPLKRTVGRARPGEPPRNVFNNVGSLGQTRPTLGDA